MEQKSLPSWECGLKSKVGTVTKQLAGSLPSWECGLKSVYASEFPKDPTSLPSWECGLKYTQIPIKMEMRLVTPFVGVWIEIYAIIEIRDSLKRHSLRGSVD